MPDFAGAEPIVVGTDILVVQDRAGGLHVQGIDESVVSHMPGGDNARLAGRSGDRAGAGIVLACLRADVTIGGIRRIRRVPGRRDRRRDRAG